MTDYHFTEQADFEAGFAEIIHARIVPILKRYEADLHEALADLHLPARVIDRLRGM